jgi:hypothetical protein
MCHVCSGSESHADATGSVVRTMTVRDGVHTCALCGSIYRLTPAGSVMVYPKAKE